MQNLDENSKHLIRHTSQKLNVQEDKKNKSELSNISKNNSFKVLPDNKVSVNNNI
jgi:hypothetical protein